MTEQESSKPADQDESIIGRMDYGYDTLRDDYYEFKLKNPDERELMQGKFINFHIQR